MQIVFSRHSSSRDIHDLIAQASGVNRWVRVSVVVTSVLVDKCLYLSSLLKVLLVNRNTRGYFSAHSGNFQQRPERPFKEWTEILGVVFLLTPANFRKDEERPFEEWTEILRVVFLLTPATFCKYQRDHCRSEQKTRKKRPERPFEEWTEILGVVFLLTPARFSKDQRDHCRSEQQL